MNDATAYLFDIFRGTTHDGPGLRNTVFFSGCPLSCKWCHNPEGIVSRQQVWHEPKTCIGCMSCCNICKTHAIIEGEENFVVDSALCTACGDCVNECPTKSMNFVRKEWTRDALVEELLKNKAFYNTSGGGVTASGGECLLQPAFVSALFRDLRAQGVHTALDTSGFAPTDVFLDALQNSDCLLLDLKLLDSGLHKQFTGVDNQRILENASLAAEYVRTGKTPLEIWIRTPLIPGATATDENISAIGRFIKDQMGDTVSRWELCAFNNVCAGKYKRLNLNWDYAQTPLFTRRQADALLKTAKATGAAGGEVFVTGLLSDL